MSLLSQADKNLRLVKGGKPVAMGPEPWMWQMFVQGFASRVTVFPVRLADRRR